MKFGLSVSTAAVVSQAWTASSWSGTVVASNLYSSSGNLACAAKSLTMSLTGSP